MKRKPLETMRCEESKYDPYRPCGKPAKFEHTFRRKDESYGPIYVCGIHANQAKRRGYNVRPIK